MKSLLTLTLGLATAALVNAAPVTLAFSASDFQNAGQPYAGYDGPVNGSISWDSNNLFDPITALTGIDLTIAGHSYTLAEVGLAPGGTTQSVVGGLFHGTNAAVGDGAKHDFLLVFDRVNPAITAFAFVIEGKLGAIWWSPAQTEAHFVTNAVPEPASGLLLVAAAGAAALVRRRRQGV